MKLSEAILLGAMMKPQGGPGTGDRSAPATCAYGAARDAMASDISIDRLWPWLLSLPIDTTCPECGKSCKAVGRTMAYGLVPHLNNDHTWTRERIAAWVATIEPQEEPVQAPEERQADALPLAE